MKHPSGRKYPKLALAALFAACGGAADVSCAAPTDLATTPLGTSTSGTTVKPNIMFILDASGSMNSDYVPDPVAPNAEIGTAPNATFNCRDDSTGSNACDRGDPPYYADRFNGLSYNPQFTYRAGVNFDGSSRGDQTAWTNVPADNYDASKGFVDLTKNFPEIGYCAASNCAHPRRNGIHNGTRFAYATHPKAELTGLSLTFSRSSSEVTASASANVTLNVKVGDVVNITDGTASCDVMMVSVTKAAASSFSFNYGDVNTLPIACRQGSTKIVFPIVGYPEAVAPTLRTRALVKGNGPTTTVTFPYHGFITGDVIKVTGGTNCLAQNGAVISNVTRDTFDFAANPANGTCSGNYTIARLPANIRKKVTGPPIFFTLSPTEYCSDLHLTNCQALSAPSGTFQFPAYVRYCSSKAFAEQAPPVTNNTGQPPCIDKYFAGKFACGNATCGPYIYPRYGLFTRGDILPSSVFTDRRGRVDCRNAPTCTFTEEMTNFANWYSYYRRRIQAMKSAAGLSFLNVDDRYRVGFILIRPSSPVVTSTLGNCASGDGEFLPMNTFDATQKRLFYCTFYGQNPSGGTPLRSALARVGRYYAHKTDGINAGMSDDPVQYSCQQNFALLTTDGYWKGAGDAPAIDGRTQVGNQDGNLNDPSGLISRAAGTYDGGCPNGDAETTGGCANTLSDIAMYYYKTDLRDATLNKVTGATGNDVSPNNVPTNETDKANWQHMVTFTVGLADGLMTWQRDYQTADTGDFKNITSGASTCFWTGNGVCNWPIPQSDTPTTLDDLWHAAVDSRGTYFHASDPQSLTAGLSSALVSVSSRGGAASSAATSSPTLTQQDNFIFSTSYSTGDWSGEVEAQTVDVATGKLQPAIWKAQAQLDARVGNARSDRNILTFDPAAANRLKQFDYSTLTSVEKAWVDNVCLPPAKLSQCAGLTAAQQATLNNGKTIVDFLRGQTQNQGTLLRARKHALGDTVDATPAYVKVPPFNFADAVTPSYAQFKLANATRQPAVYVGANDGMLHAFDATTGVEMWAYVPRMLIPRLYALADFNYPGNHKFYVDGAPVTMDAFYAGSWHTVLVAGLNGGGRGYYALDITNPRSPSALWEFCSDASCAVSDPDLGFTYGNPIITKRGGEWVVLVTSGYNNINPGSGKGFLYVLRLTTGEIIEKPLGTGAGTLDAPSGLAKIAAFADNFQLDNTTKFVYGGDLGGNIWRFDLTTSPGSVLPLGKATDATGRPQPITTRPELALVKQFRVVFIGTGKLLGLTDLQDPALLKPPSPDAFQQTFYAFKDTGAPLGNLRTSGNLVQQTLSARDPLTRTVTNTQVNWGANNGWFVDFNPGNASPGERVNIDPQLTLGTLTVHTNIPNADACSVGGDGWVYQFSYDTGSYVATSPSQIVGQKISGATVVGFVIVGLPGGTLKEIATDAFKRNPIFAVPLGGSHAIGRRIGWRELTR